MPCVVTDGVPMRRPLVTNGRAGVVGDGVLVQRDAGLVERRLGLLAGELGVEGAQVDEHQVVVGAARHEAEALAGQRLGQRRGVGDDLVRRSRLNDGLRRLAERDRLGRR